MLAHDQMQRPALWAQRQLGSDLWNMIVVGVGLPILLAFTGWMVVRLFRHPLPWRACAYVVVTLVLTVASFFTLLQVNIEMVHLPQYAILAVLFYPLTQRLSDAMILATAGGILDEGWQYFYLHGHWGTYYDVNDVILNAIGAGMGVTALYLLYPPEPHTVFEPNRGKVGKHKVVIAAGAVFAIGIVLGMTGLMRATRNPDPDQWVIALRRCNLPGSFWLTTSWGKTYHEVQAIPGTVITLGLIAFYSLLDYWPVRPRASATLDSLPTEVRAAGD